MKNGHVKNYIVNWTRSGTRCRQLSSGSHYSCLPGISALKKTTDATVPALPTIHEKIAGT